MKLKMKTVVSSALIGALLLTGAVSFASSTDTSTSITEEIRSANHNKMSRPGDRGNRSPMQNGINMIENLTDNLVEEGLITQEVADEITSYIEEKESERKAEMQEMKNMTEEERKTLFESNKNNETKEKSDLMTDIVEEGILTQDQADSIKEYIKEYLQAQKEANEKEKWDSLLAEGLITESQENEILAYYKEQEENRKTEMEKVKAMTEEERKAYLESKKSAISEEKPSPFAGLVDAGILTQDEVDAINEYNKEQMKVKMEESQEKREAQQAEQLNSLVNDGTITENQATLIVEYLEEQQEARKSEREALKDMTEEERKAYLESKKDTDSEERTIPLKELVDDGTLTEDQAATVAKIFFSHRAERGIPHGSEIEGINN